VLSVDYEVKRVTLAVEDEGRGFDAAQQTRGFGLRGMEKRARSIGAQLAVTSQAGKGTRVEAKAPLEAHMSTHGLWGTLWSRLRQKIAWPRNGRAGRARWAVRRGDSRVS
jgi:hypothetical protein